MKGFSPQNLKYMRRFAESYCFEEIGQQSIDQLPWGHVITLIYDIHDKKERLFYVERSIENGWSRNLLKMQIETYLHKRQGKALTNFEKKLPKVQSDLAQATLKDPYIFDFLSLGEEAQEREIEKSLIHHMEKFLLELGEGFAFVGRQYHIGVGDQDFYLDLLFYHLKLRCFVVIELKTGEFKPEYAGKMNFYLSAVDDLIKHPADEPTIGLILCKTKNTVLAEYTLKDMAKPIGLSEYTLNDALPEKFQTSLPTVEEIESELLKRVLESESN
jgi:predicted nuclease of restriction endonuclease-like (RecB) superfamily